MKRLPPIISFVLFIALCMSIAYWAMQIFKPPLRPVAAPPQSETTVINLDAAVTLLGSQAVATPAGNIQLKGVVASSKPSESVAVLVVDGKPPRAVKVGTEILPGVTLREVQKRYVLLMDHGQTKRVELPATEKTSAQPDTVPAPSITGPSPANLPVTPNTPRPANAFTQFRSR